MRSLSHRQKKKRQAMFAKLRHVPAEAITSICVLTILGFGSWQLGTPKPTLPAFVILLGVGTLLELLLRQLRYGDWQKGGLPWHVVSLAALMVLLIPPGSGLILPSMAVMITLLAMHLLRFEGQPLFHPLAIGLLLSVLCGLNLLDWSAKDIGLVIPLGILATAWRHRLQQVVLFLGVYITLLLLSTPSLYNLMVHYVQNPVFANLIVVLYLTPWLFAFFVLPSSVIALPSRNRLVVYTILVAISTVVLRRVNGMEDLALPLGLLIGDIARHWPAKDEHETA